MQRKREENNATLTKYKRKYQLFKAFIEQVIGYAYKHTYIYTNNTYILHTYIYIFIHILLFDILEIRCMYWYWYNN